MDNDETTVPISDLRMGDVWTDRFGDAWYVIAITTSQHPSDGSFKKVDSVISRNVNDPRIESRNMGWMRIKRSGIKTAEQRVAPDSK